METKARSTPEWREEFIQEWISLSEGRAAGANFDELVSKLYARYANIDPRIVARREWNGPVFTVPDPVEFFSHSAIRHGLIAQGEKLDRRLMALAYDLFTVSYKSETKSTGLSPDTQEEADSQPPPLSRMADRTPTDLRAKPRDQPPANCSAPNNMREARKTGSEPG